MLKGVSNSHEQVDIRLPISLDILQNLITALDMVAASPYDVSLYLAVLSAGFFGLLHPGEMVFSEHALVATNVYISSTKVVCLLPTSKVHRGLVPQSVHFYKQPNIACPVTAFIKYAKVQPPKGGAIFHKLTTPTFQTAFPEDRGQLISSFIGCSSSQIKEIGRWSSDAFKKYIHV